MADTIGSVIDKLATTNKKLFLSQEVLYKIRKMDFEEFKKEFQSEDNLKNLYEALKKNMDLNNQRQAMILEVDKKIIEVIRAAINGEELDNGTFIQNQHKTY
jgi:thiamine biosynthesis lipoprotein ApbE